MEIISLLSGVLLNQFQASTLVGTIIGGIIGNRSDKLLCSSVNGFYKKLKRNLDAPINHDIQRAVRSAYLKATLIACRSLKKQKYSYTDVFSKELTRLKQLIASIKQELKNVYKPNTELPDTDFDAQYDLLLLKDSDKTAHERLPELILLFKQAVLREFETKGLLIPDDLKSYVLQGWQDENQTIDWYELVCAFFQEELKSNTRLSAIIQAEYLSDINQAQTEIQVSLEAFEKPLQEINAQYQNLLAVLDEILDAIDDLQEDTAQIKANTAQIEEKIDRLSEGLREIARQEIRNQHITLEKLPDISVNITYQKLQAEIQTIQIEDDELRTEVADLEEEIQEEQNPERKARKERMREKAVTRRFEIGELKNEIHERLETFIIDVISISAAFQEMQNNPERLQKAQAYFEAGEFDKVKEALNEKEMDKKLDALLQEKERNAKNLRHNADEFLILAKLNSFNEECYPQAVTYFEKSLSANKNNKNLFSYGMFLYQHNKLESALDKFKECLIILENLSQNAPEIYLLDLAKVSANLGLIERKLKNYQKALKYYEHSLLIIRELLESKPDSHLIEYIKILMNIGNLRADLKFYAQAIIYFEEVLVIKRKLAQENPASKSIDLGDFLFEFALFLKRRKQEYLTYIEEALNIYRQLAKMNPQEYLVILANKLKIYAISESSISYFYEALTIYRQLFQYRSILICTQGIASLLKYRQEYEKAISYYEEAILLRHQLGKDLGKSDMEVFLYVYENYQDLIKCCMIIKNFKTAEKYIIELLTIKKAAEFPTEYQCIYDIFLEANYYIKLSKLYQEEIYQQKEASLSYAQQAIEVLSPYKDTDTKAQEFSQQAQELLAFWEAKGGG